MAKKHNHVLSDTLSEMKHFLLGAALVLALVTIVPALAQEGPGGPPPGGMGGGAPMGGDMGGQQGGGFQQGGQQGGFQQGGQQGGFQQGGFQQGGQQGGFQQGGQQGGFQQGGQQGGFQQGGQQGGTFNCHSNPAAKTPAECDAADEAAGFKHNAPGDKGPNEFMKSEDKGSNGKMKFDDKGPANKFNFDDTSSKPQSQGKPMKSFNFDAPTTDTAPSTKFSPSSAAKMAPAFKLDLSDFDDSAIVDGEAVFQSVLDQISSAKLTSKSAKGAAVSAAKFLASQAELLCGDIEDEDDASDCSDLFAKYVGEDGTKNFGKIGKLKDPKTLLKNLIKFRDAYYELAGFDLPEEK